MRNNALIFAGVNRKPIS